VSGVNVAGPFVGNTVNNSPADPANPAGANGEEGLISGSPGEVGPGSGNENIIHDTDHPSQGSGPEERGPQPEIKHGTPGEGGTGGQQSNGHDQGAVAVSLVETPAQQAAHELHDALLNRYGGDSPSHLEGSSGPGTRPGTVGEGAHLGPVAVSRVETPAEQAAHELKDALPKTSGGDSGHNVPDAGHGAHQDAVSSFADLIRAAQNPAQFGLVTTTQPPGHDTAAMLHLAAQVDIGGHSFGAPDGGHEMAAAAAVVHVDHSPAVIDQHHTVAPVLDHVQVAHH
jgi:hypothetical protein